MINFRNVIAYDSIATDIIAQASKEELLIDAKGQKAAYPYRRDTKRLQEALALFVLFDRVLIPNDLDITEFRIPILESENLIEYPSWEKYAIDKRGRSENGRAALIRNLQEASNVKALLIKSIVQRQTKDEFWSKTARIVKIPKYQFINAALEYFLAYLMEDQEKLQTNILTELLSDEILSLINSDLSRAAEEGVPDADENWTSGEALLIEIILNVSIIETLQNLSKKYKTGVATKIYKGLSDIHISKISRSDITDISKNFYLLRSIIHENGGYFPRIRGIRHAIDLRKDANLGSFREHVTLFHSYLSKGDIDSIMKIRKEIDRAIRIIERTRY